MESSDPCPLPLYLVRLLAIAVAAPDLKDETIARLAFLSPETVKKYFSRMFALTDTHDRGTLILTALRQGWIPLPPRRQHDAYNANVPARGLVCRASHCYDVIGSPAIVLAK